MSKGSFGTVVGDGVLRRPFWTPQRVVNYFKRHPDEAAAAGIDMKELEQRMAGKRPKQESPARMPALRGGSRSRESNGQPSRQPVIFIAMIPRSNNEKFVAEVARQFQPEKIVLFGSYAGGAPTEDSDVDLLVIMPHDGPAAVQAARIRQRIRGGFPMDLIVRSPEAISERLAQGDYFIQDILERGQTLYEAEHAGVG